MQTNFINTLEEAVQMVKSVDNPNFKIMMDVFHLNLEEKTSVKLYVLIMNIIFMFILLITIDVTLTLRIRF